MLTDLAHVRMIVQPGHGCAHLLRELAVALDHGLVGEDVERRERSGAPERVAGVAVRVEECGQLRVVIVERAVYASCVSTTESGR